MSIQETDAASRAVAKNDNRISLAFIESQIEYRIDNTAVPLTSSVPFLSGEARALVQGKLAHVSICTLVMRNGFVVIGKSAPLDPANFNAELGQKFAYEDAVRQLWPLFAFAKLEITTDGELSAMVSAEKAKQIGAAFR
jgi:Phage protein (N4 Gp49/phage Sf6 gene 66) family